MCDLAQLESDLLGDDKVERWLSVERVERRPEHISSYLEHR